MANVQILPPLHFLAGPSASYLTSLCLTWLICKRDDDNAPLKATVQVKMRKCMCIAECLAQRKY